MAEYECAMWAGGRVQSTLNSFIICLPSDPSDPPHTLPRHPSLAGPLSALPSLALNERHRYLLDADWSLNNGNWMWMSCSAFFHQYFRVYGPASFGKKTDKEGEFIRKYVHIPHTANDVMILK